MNTGTPNSHPGLKLTKLAGKLACVWFLFACGLSPGYGSSLGMPWPWFWATWGVMLVLALASFVGYFACKRRGEHISVFYAICPVLLAIQVLVFLNLYDIVHAILHYEGVV
jgi:hypothetical protein